MKTRTWVWISVVCLLAAAYLSYRGQRHVQESAPSGPAETQPEPGKPPRPRPPGFVLLSAQVAAAGKASNRLEAVSTNGGANAGEPKEYRLRNTPSPLEELARSDQALVLRNARVDTRGGPLAVPEHLHAGAEVEGFIVQAQGLITPSFKKALAAAGAQVVSYVPNNAYLVHAAAGAAETLRSLPEVGSVVAWEPYFKLGAGMLELAVDQQPLPEGSLLEVVGFSGQGELTLDAMRQLGAEVVAEGRSPFGPRWVVRPGPDSLPALARIPGVQTIEWYREREPANDLTRVRVRVSTNTMTTSPADQYLGLTGQGVLVSVNDSGADSSHPDLTGRIIGLKVDDTSGHGTHVIGTILGDGTKSDTVAFASGSVTGANFRGMAPAAMGFVQRAFAVGPRLGDEVLQEEAARTNAQVQNNSWAYGVFDYDLHAASFDAAVRDALPEKTGEQPLLVVFAAGNAGRGNARGLGGLADTIQSPGTAKNVITVGAVDAPRLVTNVVELCGSNDTAQPWLAQTDGDDEVAPFSARGNTGRAAEGPWGRFKPDVVAPGAMLVSCRASNYADPAGRIITNYLTRTFSNQVVAAGATNTYSDYIRADAVSFTVTVSPNADSPVPFPDLPMTLAQAGANANGNNTVSLNVPPLTEGPVDFTVGNLTTGPVNFDLTTIQAWTNCLGNYNEVLSNLNAQVGPWYRYESGSSQAAAAVSGVLALMEEYFRDPGRSGLPQALSNSPALMKALLINGARSINPQYDVTVRNVINHQGWGLVNLTNTLPARPADGASAAPVQFVEQEATNALGTGWSATRTVRVNPASRNYPLRFTLVWTDPPANPAVGLKLVNDLDLVVTNLDNPGEVYVGNSFREASLYTEPVGTNGLATNFVAALDFMNNVEQIALQPPLAGANYSVTVRGRRVNVNTATTADPDGIVQDYALVVSCGNTNFEGGLTVGGTPALATNLVAAVKEFATNLVFLLNERVGANPPYWTTTNGAREQWNFYVFTNVTTFTNLAIATFLPLNVGYLQPNLPYPVSNRRPRFDEADVDLFVSRNAALTNLDATVIAASDRSVGRLGSELIVYSNAVSGGVYYIGVKSEDQQAADYSLFAVASESPFSALDGEGNQRVPCTVFPIPDGTPDQPGGTTCVCIATMPMTVQRVVATNAITHQNPGDLIGTLSHDDVSAVLNNHYNWLDEAGPTATYVYDDSEELPVLGIPPDGPGALKDFLGEEAQGVWFFDIVDNALQHTGRVDLLTLRITPTVETNVPGSDYAVYHTGTIGPLGWMYSALTVPYDATNLEVCVKSGAPVELYVRRALLPTQTAYDWWTPASPPGACLDITPGDAPPLVPGRYYLGVFNPNGASVTVTLTARVRRDLKPGPLVTYTSTNAVPLVDDALTNAVLWVTNHQAVAMLQVGVRIDHERASDLVLHLISPQGTRILLAEDRGLTNTTGYGINFANVTTNVVATILDNSFEGVRYWEGIPTATIFAGWRVDAGDVDVFNSPIGGIIGPSHTGTNCMDIDGGVAGTISTNLNTQPGAFYVLSFACTKNLNRGGDVSFVPTANIRLGGTTVLALSTPWPSSTTVHNWHTTSVVYRAIAPLTKLEVVSTTPGNAGIYFDSFRMDQLEIVTNLYRYATFTEDPRLTRTPIKFAATPFVNTNLNLTNLIVSSFERVPPATYLSGEFTEDWEVLTNRVTIIYDFALAYQGTQCLALSSAQLANYVPTVPGNEYQVSLAYRGPGLVSWWPGESNTWDIAGVNNGAFLGTTAYGAGEVGRGFEFNGIRSYVRVPASASLNVGPGSGLTIEAWINPMDVAHGNPIVEWNWPQSGANYGVHLWQYHPSAGAGSIFANLVDTTGAWHPVFSPAGIAVPNTFQHVAVTYDKAARKAVLFLNGQPVASQTLGLFTPQTSRDLFIGTRPPGDPNSSYFVGGVDEVTLYNRGLSAAEIWGIHNASTNGKFDPLTPWPNFDVVVPGVYTNTLIAQSNWNVFTFTFVAQSNTTALEFAGHPLGVLLDALSVRETGNRYWLPEEPLTPIFGEDAYGPWTLEIWDSRLGGPVSNNAVLWSWQLQLGLAKTNPPLIVLTNTVPFSGTVSGNGWLYFAVDVPCTNGWVTNTLTANGPVDVFLNLEELPTGGPRDVPLANGMTGTRTWPPFQVPPLPPGRYFLGVRNPNPTTSVAVMMRADVTCGAAYLPAPVIQVAETGVMETHTGLLAFKLRWHGPPLAQFQVEYADAMDGPWHAIPTVITSGTGEFGFVDDGFLTPPLVGNRFYRVMMVP